MLQPIFAFFHLSINFDDPKTSYMKRLVTLAVLLTTFFFARAQTAVPAGEVLQLKETEYDFGKIPQGKPVFYTFEISNTGSTPLKLDNVQASCGCTTPEWNRDPIAPGASAQIKVGFNAAAEGTFTKPITIVYNGNRSQQIVIKGLVWKTPEGAAPANASIQFLKKQTL
jgi:hypothetical protein